MEEAVSEAAFKEAGKVDDSVARLHLLQLSDAFAQNPCERVLEEAEANLPGPEEVNQVIREFIVEMRLRLRARQARKGTER